MSLTVPTLREQSTPIARNPGIGKNAGMTRKPQSDTTFKFRCWMSDLKAFQKQAKREGFSNITEWILWHLRRIVRESR